MHRRLMAMPRFDLAVVLICALVFAVGMAGVGYAVHTRYLEANRRHEEQARVDARFRAVLHEVHRDTARQQKALIDLLCLGRRAGLARALTPAQTARVLDYYDHALALIGAQGCGKGGG